MNSRTYYSTPTFKVGVDHANLADDRIISGNLAVSPVVLSFHAPRRPSTLLLTYAARFYPKPSRSLIPSASALDAIPPEVLAADAPSVTSLMRHAVGVVYKAAHAVVGNNNAWCLLITSPSAHMQHNTASLAAAASQCFAPVTTLRRSSPFNTAVVLPKETASFLTDTYGAMAHQALITAVRSGEDQHTPHFDLLVGNPDA